jgi:hypothetical protein
MTKTSWIGLSVVLVAVAVPLGATGIRNLSTVAPAVVPEPPPGTETTVATDDDPLAVLGETSSAVPPVTTPWIGSPPGFSINPDISPSLPAYLPPTMPATVPPIGLGGPGIGVGGRGVFVIPR